MAHYMVEVPDGDDGFYEIYTPIEGGIREAVTCDECRKSIRVPSITYGNHNPVLYCNMFGVTVEPWRFCSWGEMEER